MIQALIDQCDGIMVMSEASRALLEQTYRVQSTTDVKTIKHGHYIDCYPNELTRSQARASLDIDESEKVLLALGSIKPYKGHLKLVETFGKLGLENSRLIVAGGTNNHDYVEVIEAEAERQRQSSGCQIDTYLSMVPDDQLQRYFNAADVCVLPFENVLNSGSLLMAMSFGIPIIAPATGSLPEVAFAEHSILYQSADPNGLPDAISQMHRLCLPSNQRNKYIDRTRNEYRWLKSGESLVAWYHDLISS